MAFWASLASLASLACPDCNVRTMPPWRNK